MGPNITLRIDALESQVRRWRITTLLLFIAITVMLVTASARPQESQQTSPDDQFVQGIPARRLAAHDFIVVGEDGKPYGRLYTKETNQFWSFTIRREK